MPRSRACRAVLDCDALSLRSPVGSRSVIAAPLHATYNCPEKNITYIWSEDVLSKAQITFLDPHMSMCRCTWVEPSESLVGTFIFFSLALARRFEGVGAPHALLRAVRGCHARRAPVPDFIRLLRAWLRSASNRAEPPLQRVSARLRCSRALPRRKPFCLDDTDQKVLSYRPAL